MFIGYWIGACDGKDGDIALVEWLVEIMCGEQLGLYEELCEEPHESNLISGMSIKLE